MINSTVSMIIYIIMNSALIFAFYNFIYRPVEPEVNTDLEFVKFILLKLQEEYNEIH